MSEIKPFLRRVQIRNYKSIADCDVRLGAFTLLVGRNGAGKSNFLDAIRFVAESLQTSLDHAMKTRGGIEEVRRRSTGHPNSFRIALELVLPDDQVGEYVFEVSARKNRGFTVKREELSLENRTGREIGFVVEDGFVKTFNGNGGATGGLFPAEKAEKYQYPPASSDRLYLVTAAGFPEIRPVYDALAAMGFYNLNPQEIRELQSPDPGDLLRRDGSNLAGVIGRLTDERPELKSRMQQYLKLIVPDIEDFGRAALGPSETVKFSQAVKGAKKPWQFYASSMSDGTLRALGVLVSVMQLAADSKPMRFAGIEEPETALHPAASGALIDALREAAEHTQVVITTHSPDLLDRFDPETDTLLVVEARAGTTIIDEPDSASAETIKDHLLSAGDLLRKDQLVPRSAQQLVLSELAPAP